MHNDVTPPKGSNGVEVTLKSKMAACSASSGGNSKIRDLDLSPEPPLDGPAISEHMSVKLPFLRISHFGEIRRHVDSFVTTTPQEKINPSFSLELPQCTFEPRNHCLTSLCILVRSINVSKVFCAVLL